jgi:H+/Cl- antiporter ClcA
MEFAKIVLLSIAAAICYGILHDQVTARICVEYFTIFHPPVFHTDNPTLLGLGWGVIATWWLGAFLGVVLAISARAGNQRKLTTKELIRPVMYLLAVMALSAFLFGTTGYVLARTGLIATPVWITKSLIRVSYAAFIADWWAHNASYATATVGGIVLCVMTYRKRVNFRIR